MSACGTWSPGRRPVRWRASSAGKCPQQQAYYALFEEVADGGVRDPEADWVLDFDFKVVEAPMAPTGRRALYNGTFMHLRYHLMFDDLHERELVETVMAERLHINYSLDVSGTVDRIVRFSWDDKPLTILLDFKSIRSDFYADLGGVAMADHAKQLSTYFALDFPCDWGMLLYENKDSHAIKIIDVPKNEIMLQWLKDQWKLMTRWVEQMHQGVKHGERVKVPIIETECSRCPFERMCRVEHPEREAAIKEGLPGKDVF